MPSHSEKRAAHQSERPKSREETPKEGCATTRNAADLKARQDAAGLTAADQTFRDACGVERRAFAALCAARPETLAGAAALASYLAAAIREDDGASAEDDDTWQALKGIAAALTIFANERKV